MREDGGVVVGFVDPFDRGVMLERDVPVEEAVDEETLGGGESGGVGIMPARAGFLAEPLLSANETLDVLR